MLNVVMFNDYVHFRKYAHVSNIVSSMYNDDVMMYVSNITPSHNNALYLYNKG